jgi:Fe2+ or Zn2+ uptake regulation protein
MTKREEVAATLLRAKRIRATPQRIALLSALRTFTAPQPVETIVRALKGMLDQATVYRGLQEFERADLVRRVQLKGGSLYEASGAHHHHLICRSCGAIEDVDVCLPGSVRTKLLATSKRFSTIEDDALEFFGICTACESRSS